MAINENWLVVVNPNAGSRKGEKDWPKIAKLLDEYGFKYKAVFTENRNHAIDLTASALNEGFRKIIAVGGDGTLNEVVNGIFRQKACSSNEVIIGTIPVGTGNDWGRTYEMPKKYRKAIKVIMKGYRFTQDVGHVSYYNQEEKQERYFVNVSGMGYDALATAWRWTGATTDSSWTPRWR